MKNLTLIFDVDKNESLQEISSCFSQSWWKAKFEQWITMVFFALHHSSPAISQFFSITFAHSDNFKRDDFLSLPLWWIKSSIKLHEWGSTPWRAFSPSEFAMIPCSFDQWQWFRLLFRKTLLTRCWMFYLFLKCMLQADEAGGGGGGAPLSLILTIVSIC